MYKKRILGLAIASALTLTGCLDDNKIVDESNAGASHGSPSGGTASDTAAFPVFFPASSEFPVPNDLLFSGTNDGTFVDLAAPGASPVTDALTKLSGASTSAGIDIKMSQLIDEDSVDGSPFIGGTFTGANFNPSQNIFLIELSYASGDPLQGFAAGEPPTPNPTQALSVDYTAEVKTLDGTSYLRILPKNPLKPLTRYVVAITDSITDLNGDNIIASPGVAGYAALTDADAPLANPALDPIKSLINGLWEPLALGYIGSTTNAVRAGASLPALTEDNIALTYSFMTSGDEAVLDYIADPSTWITASVTNLVKVGAMKAALAGGAGSFAAVEAVVDGAYENWVAEDLSPALVGCDLAYPLPADADDRFNCAGDGLYAAFGGSATFPEPTATTITMNGAATDVTVLNPALAASIPAGAVLADQGTMTVPYYSGLPAGFVDGAGYTPPTAGTAAAGTGLALKYTSWEADATLATTLNIAFYCSGLAIPQGFTAPAITGPDALDCSGALNPADFTTAPVSTVVNYLFPFPAARDDVTIPVLSIYPNPAAIGGATDLKTMIWGHGLTGDRSNALGFGSLAVANGIALAGATAGESLHAMIAIDEPLHGVVSGPLEASAFNAVERHFGFQDDGAGPTNPPAVIEAGGSGSMFINIESFLTSRDNNRQHALDLMTLRKSLPATTLSGNTLGGNYFYSGHSLGTINSQAFVGVVNDTTAADDDITAAAFFTPGGGVARFFENSPAFGGIVADGLAPAGVTPDTSNFQAYVNTLQASFDAFDAINFADRFAGETPVLYFLAANDLVIPVDISSTDRTLQTVTIPNGNTVSGSVSFLSGAEPLVRISGATPLDALAPGTQPITQAVARYKPCVATHGSPSIPAAAGSAFAENLSHTIGLISSDGAAVNVTADYVDLIQDLPLPALIDDADCPT